MWVGLGWVKVCVGRVGFKKIDARPTLNCDHTLAIMSVDESETLRTETLVAAVSVSAVVTTQSLITLIYV